MVEKEIRSPVS